MRVSPRVLYPDNMLARITGGVAGARFGNRSYNPTFVRANNNIRLMLVVDWVVGDGENARSPSRWPTRYRSQRQGRMG